MNFRQFFVITYLLIIIMSCIMAPVCAAENIPFAPTSNIYYEHLWYSSDIGGYLNPEKQYKQQFSPYATSMMNIKGTVGLAIANVYTFTATRTLTDADKKSISDWYLEVYGDTTKIIKYELALGGILKDIHIVPNSSNMEISWDNLGNNKYLFLMYQPFSCYFDIDVPVGSFVFSNNTDYQKDDSILHILIDQCAGWNGTSYISDVKLETIRFWPYRKVCDITYTFPTNIITNKLVFDYRFTIENNGNFIYDNIKLKAKLDNYNLGTFTFIDNCGVIESNFDYSLNTNSVHYTLEVDGTQIINPSMPYPDDYFKYSFKIGKVVPISTYDTYGGDTYGSWQSKSCKTFDFVCHLGNGIGYLIYEFPLTSSITKLVAPIGEFFIKSFDFLEGFSSIGVAYGVIFTMIIISVIMFIIFGK